MTKKKKNKLTRSSSQPKKVVSQASSRPKRVDCQDTRSLYEQFGIRWMDLDGFPELDLVVEHIKKCAPATHKKILVKRSDAGPTLEQIVEVLESELAAQSPTERLRAIVLLHTAINTVSLATFIREVSAARRSSLIKSLGKALKDPDCKVRLAAANALAALAGGGQEREIVEIMAKRGIDIEDCQTAAAEIRLLVKAGPDSTSSTVPVFRAALEKQTDTQVREWLCNAFRDLGKESVDAYPDLVKVATSNESDAVCLAAVEAILRIQRPPVSENADTALKKIAEDLTSAASDLPKLIKLLELGGPKFRALKLVVKSLSKPSKAGKVDKAISHDDQSPGDKAERIRRAAEGKPTLPRNLTFLAWSQEENSECKTPAKIRVRWNRENPSNKISLESGGLDVVKKGILAAEKFLSDNDRTLVDAINELNIDL